MKQLFSYFDLPGRGTSTAMQAAIQQKIDQGLEPLPLTSRFARLQHRNVTVHLHEAEYADLLRGLKPLLAVHRVNVEHVTAAPAAVEPATQPPVAPAVEAEPVEVEPVEVEPREAAAPLSEQLAIPDAQDRARKSRTAAIYVETTDAAFGHVQHVLDSVDNPVIAHGLTVNGVPAEHEIRFEFVAEPLDTFERVRAVITDQAQTVINCIAQGIPVYFAVPAANTPYDEFTVALDEIDTIATARVANTETRQAFLDTLRAAA